MSRKACWICILLIFVMGCTASPTLSSVEEAKRESTGEDVTLEGYIVGVPTQVNHVERQTFSSNYALALADDPEETDVEAMIFVQLDSEYRHQFGLESNPDRVGDLIVATGVKQEYFSHDGIKQVSQLKVKQTEDEKEQEQALEPPNYYEGLQEVEGKELKSKINDIIDAHNELSYDDVWEALIELDGNPAEPDEVLLLYSGRSMANNANGGGVDEWNREHVWPQSHGDFGTSMGPGTDLHHLKPTDTTINSSRGNLDFDNGGEAHDEAEGTYSDSDSWEPRDEVKGDVARMVFYMAVRYEGEREGEPDLELVDRVETDGPVLGKLSTLKEWHEADPVDDFERERNELIYSTYQGNRNPFIDHPEFVERIW
ncbi:endonuclease [Halobacillus locisalis]|uniref:Endonuclease n=1 Tax=Halobacillus locisalis TaxID=220753 RepID=A0A838CXR2_9BACI|nr:endonuclease [Halobacillus locisalis]MBA2176386.1 endonuclease [Halobacillus locisalis]